MQKNGNILSTNQRPGRTCACIVRTQEDIKLAFDKLTERRFLLDANMHHQPNPNPEPDLRAPPTTKPMHPRIYFFCLVVSGAGLRELEDNTTAGEAAVDLRVGIQPVVNTTALLLVEDDLEDLGAVLLGAEALADDLDGVDEVGQDGIVDGRESAGARALLLEGVAGAGRALGARENAASGNEEDVAVRELLLQLAGEAVMAASQHHARSGRG